MTVAAVIVAGGSGLRAGGDIPKQYQMIGGRPVIWWTLKAFLEHPAISHVQVVVGQGHEQLYQKAVEGLELPRPVTGGSTRQSSCRIGVEACVPFGPEKVLIHDAARPFVSAKLISALIEKLDQVDAVVPGLAVADTMKFAPGGVITKTVSRDAMWFVQTPQAFRFTKIRNAHKIANEQNIENLTDDASVAEAAGMEVSIIAGEQQNRKLTTQNDIMAANRELSQDLYQRLPDVRIGQGIDFHVFEEGQVVTLCGVQIPHTHKLKGHSDADVALHAVTDAILGAIGEGDIGVHFPPSDIEWKNAQSSIFVAHAVALLKARGGLLVNVDITLLAEAPKISPHILAMKAMLGPLLEISTERIAIKATTTEAMGAIGRKEGMAAIAVATVRLPA